MELALQYYELAEDYLSLVRVHCYCENLEKAAEIANSSGDKAACYHLARQYENMDNIANAIHFFSKASAYSNAIRICKEQGYADHVWNLALLASSNEKLDAAKYFERGSDKPQYDKAVILYEKAGYFGKALDLAVKTNQHNALQHISKHLDSDTDPVLLGKAANFFLENKQYDKAVDLFVASKDNQKALDLCLQYNISVTEEMAEKLTVDRDGKTNNELLNNLAEVCYRQGNYTLATKKWTQAGNRLQAMKALLKSGDTEKVVKFANISRERDIYVLAANYLQTLDWRNDAEVMRSIIAFYQKAKAFDLLGWFYQSCADVEIDEYQNYEKALGALNEALKASTYNYLLTVQGWESVTDQFFLRAVSRAKCRRPRDENGRRSAADRPCHEVCGIPEGVLDQVRNRDRDRGMPISAAGAGHQLGREKGRHLRIPHRALLEGSKLQVCTSIHQQTNTRLV